MGYEPRTQCYVCHEPFDVYMAPGNRRCEDCIDILVADKRRAVLGVDGNAGFALIGLNLQEGEAEFISIEDAPDWAETKFQREGWAATKAFRKLRDRLNRKFSYYIGPSHPRHI